MTMKAHTESESWTVANALRTAANTYRNTAKTADLLAPRLVEQFYKQARQVELLAEEFEQSDGFDILTSDR